MTDALLLDVPAPTDAKEGGGEVVTTQLAVAEFFAGIGLARLGLESSGFKVTWANDIEPAKKKTYLGHFGEDSDHHYVLMDIRAVADDIAAHRVPDNLDLAWASFPCTDLSLAGGREGLAGKNSGTFWNLIDILDKLDDKRPRVVALENVNGFATSHGGEDLRAAVRALNDLKYSVDVLTLDARSWVPQSRPRLFLVAARDKPKQEDKDQRNKVLRPAWLDWVFDANLRTHRADLPLPPALTTTGWTALVSDLGDGPDGWWDEVRTAKFRSELSAVQRQRVADLAESGQVVYRTAYRRTRNGVPAWEIRADDIAGCLRTAGGGSSKQAVVRIEKGKELKVRWMRSKEYAALMGARDYALPERHSQTVMGFGDAVCVDAVRWLADNYLGPLLRGELNAEVSD